MSEYDFYKLDVEKAKEVFASDWDLLWGDEFGEGWCLYDLEVYRIDVKGGFEKEYNKKRSPVDIEISLGYKGEDFQETPQFQLAFYQVEKYQTTFDLTKKFNEHHMGVGLYDIMEWHAEKLENGHVCFKVATNSALCIELECSSARFIRTQ